MSVASLRERKKEKTRRLLVETARRLFVEQGYEATTLEQIAAEAEVAVATLVRYFDTKARLILDPLFRSLEDLRESMRDPDRAEAASVFQSFIELEAVRYGTDAGVGLEASRVINEASELSAKWLKNQQEMEDLVAEGLSRDAGTDPTSDLYAQILAATLVGAARAAHRRWVEDGGGEGDLATICSRAVGFVLDGFPDRKSWAAVNRRQRRSRR